MGFILSGEGQYKVDLFLATPQVEKLKHEHLPACLYNTKEN